MNLRKILTAFTAFSLLAAPMVAEAGSFSAGRSSSFSSARSSSFSSSRSFSAPSYTPSRSYTPAARPAPAPARTGGSFGANQYRPAPQQYRGGAYRSGGTNTTIVEHHTYGGTFSNPWFWMWAASNHNQQPVVVQQPVVAGQPAVVDGGQVAAPVYQDNGPGFFGTIFYGLLNLLIFAVVLGGIIWLVVVIKRKFF